MDFRHSIRYSLTQAGFTNEVWTGNGRGRLGDAQPLKFRRNLEPGISSKATLHVRPQIALLKGCAWTWVVDFFVGAFMSGKQAPGVMTQT